MRADFSVVLDACVLAEAAVSDLFLRLAEEPRLLSPKWSDSIWKETRRTYIERLGWPEELANSRILAATEAFPEAMVFGSEHLIPACTNHPDDRHVLAVAIHSKSETIVTFNERDFKRESLHPWGISAVHPAAFLSVLDDLDSAAVTSALHSMAAKSNRSLPEMLARLSWSVEPFSAYVARHLSLDLPKVSPTEWKR